MYVYNTKLTMRFNEGQESGEGELIPLPPEVQSVTEYIKTIEKMQEVAVKAESRKSRLVSKLAQKKERQQLLIDFISDNSQDNKVYPEFLVNFQKELEKINIIIPRMEARLKQKSVADSKEIITKKKAKIPKFIIGGILAMVSTFGATQVELDRGRVMGRDHQEVKVKLVEHVLSSGLSPIIRDYFYHDYKVIEKKHPELLKILNKTIIPNDATEYTINCIYSDVLAKYFYDSSWNDKVLENAAIIQSLGIKAHRKIILNTSNNIKYDPMQALSEGIYWFSNNHIGKNKIDTIYDLKGFEILLYVNEEQLIMLKSNKKLSLTNLTVLGDAKYSVIVE